MNQQMVMVGKGQAMYSNEFLAAIKADREREIKAAERAHLVDRTSSDDGHDGEAGGKVRSIRRRFRPSIQPGRTTPDPSL